MNEPRRRYNKIPVLWFFLVWNNHFLFVDFLELSSANLETMLFSSIQNKVCPKLLDLECFHYSGFQNQFLITLNPNGSDIVRSQNSKSGFYEIFKNHERFKVDSRVIYSLQHLKSSNVYHIVLVSPILIVRNVSMAFNLLS